MRTLWRHKQIQPRKTTGKTLLPAHTQRHRGRNHNCIRVHQNTPNESTSNNHQTQGEKILDTCPPDTGPTRFESGEPKTVYFTCEELRSHFTMHTVQEGHI